MKDKHDIFTTELPLDVGRQVKPHRSGGGHWVGNYDGLSCLAAYERKAIDDGMESNPVFPENIAYLSFIRQMREALKVSIK